MPVIYEKTPAGRQVLSTRQPELSRALRNLLLLIDGTKSDQELMALLNSNDLSAASFGHLQQLGFIAQRAELNAAHSVSGGLRQTAAVPAEAAAPQGAPTRRASPFARLGQGLRSVLQSREESPREISAGLAEVVKCAAVADADFFSWLEGHIEELLARQQQSVTHVVQRIPELRASIEAQDRVQRRSPSSLDFGMALARVIESILGYGQYLHGEAVGLGMWLTAAIGQDLGVQSEASAQRLRALLHRCALPTQPPQVAAGRWLDLLPVDRAGSGGQIQFVLLEDIAKPVARLVPRSVVVEALDRAGALNG
ncbi:hypothetical protein [Thiomonas sp. FB-Cd]|uniref:3-dehydroquinate synthase family protein n=1 Tax=Thiomonas sp. FB-Cd TaxID=1158292 RepID=UPI00068E3AD4|nr:hypothetical protein [Thiomonas sp. FB-Cd]